MTDMDSSAPSLAERLRGELRSRIVDTRLRPGAVLLEKALAEEHAVSKTPVREALQMLAVEGWVQVIPRRGYTVSSMGFHDIREVMELRRAIEPTVAASAAATVTRDLVDDLERLLDGQRSATSHARAVSAAAAFHRRIAQAARNHRAQTTLDRLFAESERAHALLPPLAAAIADTEVAAHQDVVDAIRSADPRRAETVMRQHLVQAESAIVAAHYH
ncbi:GntR family transcriptional regulator [Arsenicicoccus dermatophilus]|uniref:GntR family transcriptional regulator n=1 Tax=Arsenicicoccus dermatophilus TaxID=1076331 RepID=UPI0039173AA4